MHKLAKSGQIPQLPNGRYDLAAVQKALAENIEPSRQRRVHPAKRGSGERLGEQAKTGVNTPAAKPIATLADAAEAVQLIRHILEEEGVKVGAAVDFQGARTAELILKTRERWLKIEVEEGRLCDTQTVHSEAFRMARATRDQFQNWPSQVGALIANELGVADIPKVIIVLENYVRRFLTELTDPKLRLVKQDREDT
jgi:hypothetical protein